MKHGFPSEVNSPLFRREKGRVVAQAVSRWLPTAAPGFTSGQNMWGGLWWTKPHWGRFSLSTSVSPINRHSTNFSIIIITHGWHNRPIGGRSTEWIQFDFTPTTPIKNIDTKFPACYET
jgi:hypothetical protein